MERDYKKEIDEIIVDHLDLAKIAIKPEKSLQDDLGADSLDLVEMNYTFEDKFGKELPDDRKYETVEDVYLAAMETLGITFDYDKKVDESERPAILGPIQDDYASKDVCHLITKRYGGIGVNKKVWNLKTGKLLEPMISAPEDMWVNVIPAYTHQLIIKWLEQVKHIYVSVHYTWLEPQGWEWRVETGPKSKTFGYSNTRYDATETAISTALGKLNDW